MFEYLLHESYLMDNTRINMLRRNDVAVRLTNEPANDKFLFSYCLLDQILDRILGHSRDHTRGDHIRGGSHGDGGGRLDMECIWSYGDGVSCSDGSSRSHPPSFCQS